MSRDAASLRWSESPDVGGGEERATVPSADGRVPPGEPLLSHEPSAVGPYTLVSRLGTGGMGTVYFAHDPTGRPVAIKVIRSDRARDQEFRRRFRRETEAARSVASFCTAEVLDADPEAFDPYLVTEYIDGVRLDRVVGDEGPLRSSTLTGLAVGVATALAAIHHAGLVHRDLKPSNVILSLSGPRVIDFGIAQPMAGAGARPTAWGFGSTGWMSPEQLAGEPIGPAADVFTWGILIAYAGTGRHPFGDEKQDDITRRIATAEPDLDGLDQQIVDLVRAALEKNPVSRPDARGLLLGLIERQPAASVSDPASRAPSQTVGSWGATRANARTRWVRLGRRGSRVSAAAAILAVLVTTGWSVAHHGDEGRSRPATVRTGPASTPAATPPASAGVQSDPDGFRDGALQFTVDGVECGVNRLGLGMLARRPNGQFCLVTVTVRNLGAGRLHLENTDQFGYDAADGRHTADFLSRLYLPGESIWETMDPGASTHGRLVFDIPPGSALIRLELHLSRTSGGVSIPL